MLINKHNTSIIGHRGAAGLAFENTISSISKALELGITCVEIDVWQITTGELIVFHDAYLDRLTESSGSTDSLTYEQLSTIRLRNGEYIPTLESVIEFVKQHKIRVIVEVKHEKAIKATYELLNKALKYSDFIIGSFFHTSIMELKIEHPLVQTAIMFESVPVGLSDYLNLVNPDYVVVSNETFNEHLVNTIINQSRRLIFYTVNSIHEMKAVKHTKPYGIITNYPNLFI